MEPSESFDHAEWQPMLWQDETVDELFAKAKSYEQAKDENEFLSDEETQAFIASLPQ